MKRIAVLILVFIMAGALAGCNAAPASTPTPAPTAAATATPEPTPIPAAQVDMGLLAADEPYYIDGDTSNAYLLFSADGKARQVGFGGGDVDAEFTVDGGLLSIFYENELVAAYNITDAYTLVDVDDESSYIREGGAAVNASADAMPAVFNYERYYENGVSGDSSIYFYDDGDVELEADGESVYYPYTINGDTVSITMEGEQAELLIQDAYTLLDEESGIVYALEGALDAELVLGEIYYLQGNKNYPSMFFGDDGIMLFTDEGNGETITYSEDDGQITLTYDSGDEMTLRVISSYILESSNGQRLLRWP